MDKMPKSITKAAVSRALLDYRGKNHFSQEALAYKLEVSPMQVLRWEKKKTMPNRLSLKLLCELKILSYEP